MEKRKEKNRDCLMIIYICLCAATVLITLHTRVHVLHDCDIIIGERD